MRFWYQGGLFALPADLLRRLDDRRHHLDESRHQLEEANLRADKEWRARLAGEQERARGPNRGRRGRGGRKAS